MINVCIGTNFNDVPKDVLSQNAYMFLSNTDAIKSILRLNRHGYNHFVETNKHDIHVIKQIECIINSTKLKDSDLIQLYNLVNQVQLSELYALKLPDLLNKIGVKHLFADSLMKVMNIKTMNFTEFKSISSFYGWPSNMTFIVKLLVLSSRVLAPFSTSEIQYIADGKVLYPWRYNEVIFDYEMSIYPQYPWLKHPKPLHIIYFSHLYQYLLEHCYKELNIPPLHAMYTKTSKILCLIYNEGFIPWHKHSLHYFRKNKTGEFDYIDILEIHRINNLFFEHDKYQWIGNDVMTRIFVAEFNIKATGIIPSRAQLKAVTIIHNLALYNFVNKRYRYFGKLKSMITTMFKTKDEVVWSLLTLYSNNSYF